MRLKFWKRRPEPEPESAFVQRAEREVRLAGLLDEDSDYGGMIGEAVMELVRTLSAQRHSGYSIGYVMHVTQQLVDGKALTPLTSNPEDWINVSDMSGTPMWQNRRCSSAFSDDGGATWTLLDDETKTIYRDEAK